MNPREHPDGSRELNQAIREALEWLNNKPLQKFEGSQRSLYETIDRPALKLFPARRYEFTEWREAKVNIDYHVEVDQLVQQSVDLTASTVKRSCIAASGSPATPRRPVE